MSDQVKVLNLVGRHPQWSVEQIAEEIDRSKASVVSTLSKCREYGRVVKAPSYDQDKGLEWELTGTGYQYLKANAKKLLKGYPAEPDLDKINYHLFKPLGKRKSKKVS